MHDDGARANFRSPSAHATPPARPDFYYSNYDCKVARRKMCRVTTWVACPGPRVAIVRAASSRAAGEVPPREGNPARREPAIDHARHTAVRGPPSLMMVLLSSDPVFSTLCTKPTELQGRDKRLHRHSQQQHSSSSSSRVTGTGSKKGWDVKHGGCQGGEQGGDEHCVA